MEEFINTYLFNPTIGKLVTLFIGIVVIWSVVQILQRNVLKNIKEKDTRYKSRKLLHFFGYFLILILLTLVYRDKLGGLTIALGVAGAGIAFALQEVITSVAGWLAIALGGFFKTGDRVQLGGIIGDVIDIGVLRSTIMETGQWVDGDLYNGRIVRIANSFVFKEPVFNYSGDFPFLWDEIKIPVQYGSNYEKTRELLLNVARETVGEFSEKAANTWKGMVNKYLIENASTEPMVTLIANDNWVEFTLRYTVDFKKRRSSKDLLFTRILKEVESMKGEIKFASATFQLVDAPEINVKIKN